MSIDPPAPLEYSVERIADALEEIAAGVTELANTKRIREMNMQAIQDEIRRTTS